MPFSEPVVGPGTSRFHLGTLHFFILFLQASGCWLAAYSTTILSLHFCALHFALPHQAFVLTSLLASVGFLFRIRFSSFLMLASLLFLFASPFTLIASWFFCSDRPFFSRITYSNCLPFFIVQQAWALRKIPSSISITVLNQVPVSVFFFAPTWLLFQPIILPVV